MSVVLYLLGIVSVAAGAAAIVLGLPVKEFSFGNTLIMAGTTGVVGGLILIGLGAAVSQLQRVVEMLGARPLSRSGRGVEPFEGVRLGNGPGRVPFPPKPKSEPRERPAEIPAMPIAPARDSEPEFAAAPSLRNPDVPLMAEEEARHLPLSPRDNGAPRAETIEDSPTPEPTDEAEQASFEPGWRSPPASSSRPPQPSYFENMWPAPDRHAPDSPEPTRDDSIPHAAGAPEAEPSFEDADEDAAPVAVLKSGVVDGMGYTLYVDGSIEAELPDGTLRFASINELRMHLERNSQE